MTESTVVRTEGQRLLKENNIALEAVLSDAYFIKLGSQNVLKELLINDNDARLERFETPLTKTQRGEEMILGRLSGCLRLLSQLRALVYSVSAESADEVQHVERILALIQDLHVDMNEIIQILPEASGEGANVEMKGEYIDSKESYRNKQQQGTFRDQLIRDQQELHRRLQNSLNNINRNEVNVMLSKEVEMNQVLCQNLEDKDLFINDLVAVVSEGISKTNAALAQLAKIADSEDAFELIGCVLSEVDSLKSQVQGKTVLYKTEETARSLNRNREDLPKYSSRDEAESNRYQTKADDVQARGLKDLEGQISELKELLEQADKENKSLKDRIAEGFEQRSVESFGNNNADYALRRVEDLESENTELREHRRSTDLALKKAYEQISKLKITYFSEVNVLKEEIKVFSSEKQQMAYEIEKRDQELDKLNQLIDSLQNFSNKQLETVKDREQKLNGIAEQKK